MSVGRERKWGRVGNHGEPGGVNARGRTFRVLQMSLKLLHAVPHAGEHTRVRPDATRLPARGVVILEKICFRFQRVGPFFYRYTGRR